MIKVGDTVQCKDDKLHVFVEDIDIDCEIAYVFDMVNYNGGWIKLKLLEEIKDDKPKEN